jgi:hypothetical protein
VPYHLRKQKHMVEYERDLALATNELHDARSASTKHQGPNLPYFDLPYCLSKDQLSFLSARFPRTKFRCSVDVSHDHPIAHSETMIATSRAQRMIAGGHTVVDLFGSPQAATALNKQQRKSTQPKRWVPYVALKSEKDYLRSLHWGEEVVGGNRRYVRGDGDVLGEVVENGRLAAPFGAEATKVTYFAKHTLYYLSDEEIAGLLRVPKSRMLAIVHRHPDSSGRMFAGECTYAKVAQDTVVEQVNVLTGERYVHRDMSWLWTSTTKVKRTSFGAFVWTFHMVSPETWIIELTGCPPGLDERFRSRAKDLGVPAACQELNSHAEAPTSFPHPALAQLPRATCALVGSVPVISFDKSLGVVPVRLTCPGLFDYLCAQQVGKPRDTDRLHDLFSLARSHVSNGSDFPGKRNFNVAPADIAGHVILAFVTGVTEETCLLRALESFRSSAREHHSLLDGGSVVVHGSTSQSYGNAAVSVMKRVNAARKQGDTFDGILRAIE